MTPGDPRVCRLCGERPVSAAPLRHRDYRCTRCRNTSAPMKAAKRRYRQSPKGKAKMAVSNARRIMVGDTYNSYVALDIAAAVNTHIKERRREFKSGQQNREKTEGPTAG